jgi:uncharacterized repeat protein (TIGR03803 family)
MIKHYCGTLICLAALIGTIAPSQAQTPGLNTLYAFPTGQGTNGSWPRGGLAMDTTGTLYGTTFYGGNCPISFPFCGTIYKLAPPAAGQTAWTYSFLHGFSQQVPIGGNNEDGISPISPLNYYQGVLYGTASAGGDTNCGCGIVFSITPGGTYTILHTFDPFVPGAMDINQWPNGATPIGGLLINNGTIYGTTNSGGNGGAIGPDGTNGAGVLYSLSTTGSGFTVLHNFDGGLNTGPQGMIIFGQDNAIYGTQFGGGQYNQGVIWRMPIGGTYQVLYNFLGTNQPGNSSDGADPEGRLALGPDGTIYGTTSFGGDPSGDGTAWSIKLTNGTWVYNQIYKFNGNTGGSLPHSGLILAADGALYGTTAGGGLYGGGTFYKLVPNGSSWTYVTLHNFIPRDPNGDSPYGDLLYANNNFYGMNLTGGSIAQCVNNSNGCGTVFQFNLRTTHNFNGDGFSDIAWRDSSGNTVLWEMNGTAVLNQNSSFVANVPGQWAIVGQRDFNGDGKADLLWRDTSGNVAIWEMNGTTVLNPNSSFVGNVPTPQWSILGTGDFNGDAKGDLLWQDTSGNVAIWEMNGTAVLNQNSSFVAKVPGQWSIKGTGDFNGDGKTDILWQDTSGNVAIWEMNGTSILNANSSLVSRVGAQWSIKGTGDFNGDGMSDILWQDSSGNVAIWEMSGTTILNANSSLVGNVASQWSIQLTGDYNGDGKSDIIWQDSSGNVAIWEMNGTTLLNGSNSFVTRVVGQWTIQHLAAD